MRKLFRRHLPHPDNLCRNRWLAPFSSTLLHPRLWHLNRHSAAGAVAVGLFCGLIPGPLQTLFAILFCLLFKVNLPLALVTTIYTNPLTIVPLWLLAYNIGESILDSGKVFVAPPEWQGSVSVWLDTTLLWMMGLGKPLALGLIVLAAVLSFLGYVSVRAAWRYFLIRAWRQRSALRNRKPS